MDGNRACIVLVRSDGAVLLPLLPLSLLPLVIFSFALHQLLLMLHGPLSILIVHSVARALDRTPPLDEVRETQALNATTRAFQRR